MRVPYHWLKEYLKTEATPKDIADKLTAIGLEIEEIIEQTVDLKDFIIAEIVHKEKHPNADRLNVLTVDSGTEKLQIVCGAPNCRVGLKGILALPGTMIPCYGEKLEKGVIRGVESHGMMCSEKELGLGDNHDGIIDLTTDLPVGTSASALYSSETVLDVNVTPNRGDCFGIQGIARDLSATGIGTYAAPDATPVKGSFKSPVGVTITDDNCPMFVGRYIKNVKNVESPAWMKERLIAAGLRPISALVDITNYLNIGSCRPLHVFDADKLTGNITVRSANDGEKLAALDEKEYTLSQGMTVIADDKTAQSIGGIMGGSETGCSASTANVFLESAYFVPISIAKTARILGAESDSKSRFERGIDPASCIDGNEIATRLILEICGGEASELVIAGKEPDWKQAIDFDFGLVKKICGLDIPQKKMEEILSKLGFETTGSKVSVPSWRANDVKQQIDLVEEIVRINGLDDLPEISMRAQSLPTGVLQPSQKREIAVRRAMAARGLNQAITWSFMDSKFAKLFNSNGIKIANPIASDLDEMRPSLIPNLIAAAKRNIDRGIKDVQLFETGPEFHSNVPGEQNMITAGIRAGNFSGRNYLAPARPVDLFDAKADALDALASMEAPLNLQVFKGAPDWYHPGRSGKICLGKNTLAYFGEIHPRILKAYDIKTTVIGFEVLMDNIPATKAKSKAQKLLKLSQFMPLTRDFAFVMDKNTEAGKVIATIQNVDKDKITDVSVFDIYTGDKLPADKKSLAIQVTIWPKDKTMTDQEIEILSTQIVNMVAKNCQAELRTA
ncbi:MAG: phenylalanine--tRNA ligase subunit beta [Lactobacillales bacterium]|jgi:phenylalanyl-tRNA synthetase beta chain|nr:phenylalanine--tRNA ligase subunit beta [Lactobacillales bacterium]